MNSAVHSHRWKPVSISLVTGLVCAIWMPHSATALVAIGNFYKYAPNGIAFIKDDSAAFVMDPGGLGSPGTVAPDDSYHAVLLKGAKTDLIRFEWSRVGDVVVGRIESEVPDKLAFRLDKNWPDFISTYSSSTNGVNGNAKTPAGNVAWVLQTKPAPLLSDDTSVTLSLGGVGSPTYLAAGFGVLPPFARIDQLLDEAKQNYERRRPKAESAGGDIVGAITDNLNNSRVYSTDNHLTAISVSRTFGGNNGPNNTAYFCWDSFFNGLLASVDNPEMARETVRAILSGQGPDGLVPNFTHWTFHDSRSSMDRSQPPVGAMCVWKMHLRHPDVDFLREVYPKLALWHAWWMKARNAKGDGLLEWGSSLGTLQGAQWETGWDDTPGFQGVPGVKMAGSTMNVYAVDLCSLWAMDARYLAQIAGALGEKRDAGMYQQQEKEMNERINARLWNEELGVYCSRFWDEPAGPAGKFLTRLTPANFYPLSAGAASPSQAKRVLAIMTDRAQFWGEFILPTVSRNDPLFFQQRYWHGTIWGPVNYLVYQGVKRYGSPRLQAEFAQKSVHLFMNNWLGGRWCGENFYSLNGQVGGDQNYTWGALMCLIGMESVMDIQDDGTIKAGPGYNEPVTLENIPAGGKCYRATVRYGNPMVSVEADADKR